MIIFIHQNGREHIKAKNAVITRIILTIGSNAEYILTGIKLKNIIVISSICQKLL